ncbi:MAG: hypothetical protein ABSF92_10600 [Candidatus Acidiferrales bacterium]
MTGNQSLIQRDTKYCTIGLLVLVCVAAFLACGCSDSKSLTRSHAAELIGRSSDFNKPKTVEFLTGSVWDNSGGTYYPYLGKLDTNLKAAPYPELQSAGIIEISRSEPTPTRQSPVPPCFSEDCSRVSSMWKVSLTKDGVSQSNSWTHQTLRVPIGVFKGAVAEDWVVPVAKSEIVEVTGIAAGETGQAQADFTWKWRPIDKIGQAINLNSQIFKASANLRLYDDGWRVEHVRKP